MDPAIYLLINPNFVGSCIDNAAFSICVAVKIAVKLSGVLLIGKLSCLVSVW